MPPDDFTVAQATDLARYFLGPDWVAVFLSFGTRPYMLRLETKYQFGVSYQGDQFGVSYQGESWREVFRAATVHLPMRPQYVAKGLRVAMADRAICTAASNTMAKRIAAALNDHIPDRRGI